MQVAWHYLVYCCKYVTFSLQTCAKGLHNLCVKNSPVTTSNNKAFRFELWTFFIISLVLWKEVCHTSLALESIKAYTLTANNIYQGSLFCGRSQTVKTYTAYECRSVSILCRRKRKTTSKIKLSQCVATCEHFRKSRFTACDKSSSLDKCCGDKWILTLYVTGECCPIPVLSQSYDSTLKENPENMPVLYFDRLNVWF